MGTIEKAAGDKQGLVGKNERSVDSCPLWRSCYIGSCHVGVSKRFSYSISLAVYPSNIFARACCLKHLKDNKDDSLHLA